MHEEKYTKALSPIATGDDPPLFDRIDPLEAFRVAPGQTLQIALCVDVEATPDDPFAHDRCEALRRILAAHGLVLRDARLSVPVRSLPSGRRVEQRRRAVEQAREVAKKSLESRLKNPKNKN
jgi:hypothetical protein